MADPDTPPPSSDRPGSEPAPPERDRAGGRDPLRPGIDD